MGVKELLIEKGREKGREEQKVALVKRLLATNQLTVAIISGLTNVSEAIVRKIRKGIIIGTRMTD
jgi:uncharacterized protein with FMN-binding domain